MVRPRPALAQPEGKPRPKRLMCRLFSGTHTRVLDEHEEDHLADVGGDRDVQHRVAVADHGVAVVEAVAVGRGQAVQGEGRSVVGWRQSTGKKWVIIRSSGVHRKRLQNGQPETSELPNPCLQSMQQDGNGKRVGPDGVHWVGKHLEDAVEHELSARLALGGTLHSATWK